MLKKLVRYGNSNALVLDKAILELLNISEGSIVKIKTDGHSIIITPHQEAISQKVTETVTCDEALLVAGVRQSLEFYKGLPASEKAVLEQELLVLIKKQSELLGQVAQNEQFQKELTELKSQCGKNEELFAQVRKQLIEKYQPELRVVNTAMNAFYDKCNQLSGNVTDSMTNMREAMEKDFAAVFAKNKDIQADFASVLNSPDYQHRAQLLTEKFQDNQNSVEFNEAMQQLMYEFCPAMKTVHQDVAAVAKKYEQFNV